MWRFILITFGFLGFAFWELSGGADYKPADNSIQARANQPADIQPEVQTASVEAQPAQNTQAAAEPATTLADLQNAQDTSTDRLEITLASVSNALANAEIAPANENKAALLTQPTSSEDTAVLAALTETEEEVREVWPGAIELFAQQRARQELRAEAEEAARDAMDIRYVTGNVVNMRGGPGTDFEKITSLTEGDQVAVLQSPGNGWLELQVVSTGETGWMADWLVSAPAQ